MQPPPDRYQLVRRLRATPQVQSYEARHPRRPGRFLVEVLGSLREGPAREAFERDLAAISQLRHPYMLQTLELSQLPDGTPIVVSELPDGPTLQDRLEGGVVAPLPAVLALIDALAQALQAAQARGVTHGTLDAGSVFLVPNVGAALGIPRLHGFGRHWLVGQQSDPVQQDLAAFAALAGRLLNTALPGLEQLLGRARDPGHQLAFESPQAFNEALQELGRELDGGAGRGGPCRGRAGPAAALGRADGARRLGAGDGRRRGGDDRRRDRTPAAAAGRVPGDPGARPGHRRCRPRPRRRNCRCPRPNRRRRSTRCPRPNRTPLLEPEPEPEPPPALEPTAPAARRPGPPGAPAPAGRATALPRPGLVGPARVPGRGRRAGPAAERGVPGGRAGGAARAAPGDRTAAPAAAVAAARSGVDAMTAAAAAGPGAAGPGGARVLGGRSAPGAGAGLRRPGRPRSRDGDPAVRAGRGRPRRGAVRSGPGRAALPAPALLGRDLRRELRLVAIAGRRPADRPGVHAAGAGAVAAPAGLWIVSLYVFCPGHPGFWPPRAGRLAEDLRRQPGAVRRRAAGAVLGWAGRGVRAEPARRWPCWTTAASDRLRLDARLGLFLAVASAGCAGEPAGGRLPAGALPGRATARRPTSAGTTTT